ncbi:MAG: ABC transporter permease [Verrucomicrobiaceae bacterium]|nr:ABC transporter permease [Verrucomicrobiaceae bacterium]NCF94958.1 ABC transporter permease [Verrucomicrobiaceae bacterium]
MKGAPDISWLALASCFLLLLIPLAVTAKLRLGLTRDLLVAVCRMTLQLILAGFYLGYLFKWNHPGMNLAWLAVMLVAASGSVLYNSALRWSTFIIPAFLALALATLGIVLYLNAFVVRLENLFEARYLIVLGGMLLGNCLSANIISASRFYQAIDHNRSAYESRLGNGAPLNVALRPYMKESLTAALRPGIAAMMTMGLVSLPGMMTGQMLGGSDPGVAIKYQIAIMIAIFTCTTLSISLFLLFTRRVCFDPQGNLRTHLVLKPK